MIGQAEVYVTYWWIRGNLLIMTNKIQFWNKVNEDHLLNDCDEEVWYENGNDSKKKLYRWAYIFSWWIGNNLPIMINRFWFWYERDVDHVLK